MTGGREARLAEIVGAVARQALEDAGASRIALIDDGSPEADLAARLMQSAVAPDRLVRVTDRPELEPLLQTGAAGAPRQRVAEEVRRMWARLVPDAVVALPANKTALLLGGPLPPDPLLPLGDLYASDVLSLAGGWSAPAAVVRLAERSGGVERLDGVLRARFDGRDARALLTLQPGLREEVEAALERGAASRVMPRVVPKIGYRTLGLDLLE